MTQKEYTALVDRCKQLSYEYYVLAKPTVSDAQFDALVSEIEQAEAEHPEWTLADSPTQMVGSDVQDNGRRLIRHRTRMLSCQKAQTQEAVTKWITATEKKLKKVDDVHYVLEWKLDGISCSLVYQDGVLISAATRGEKGMMGQDLMEHVRLMPSVPKTITESGRIEVRGEIVCLKASLPWLGYKDCRTAAAALTNALTPSHECNMLDFVAWQLESDERPIGTETVSMDIAERLGFKTSGYKGCWGKDVLARLDEFEAKREALPYPTDGVVIKIDMKPVAASLGATEHHPKGNIAYKFSAQKAVTRVVRIEISIGATGKRTPVAYLEPVMILGREVSAASLYSENKMTELGVKEGCMVEVGLSNDVTPKIYRVIKGHTESADNTESHEIVAAEETTTDSTDETDNIESAGNQSSPEPSPQNDAPEYSESAKSVESVQSVVENTSAVSHQPSAISHQPSPTPRPRRRASKPEPSVAAAPPLTVAVAAPAVSQSDDLQGLKNVGKALAIVIGLSAVLVVLWQTGLIIPLGLIGLGISGFLR